MRVVHDFPTRKLKKGSDLKEFRIVEMVKIALLLQRSSKNPINSQGHPKQAVAEYRYGSNPHSIDRF